MSDIGKEGETIQNKRAHIPKLGVGLGFNYACTHQALLLVSCLSTTLFDEGLDPFLQLLLQPVYVLYAQENSHMHLTIYVQNEFTNMQVSDRLKSTHS